MLFDSKWITYKTGQYKSCDDKYGNPSPYFRKTFTLKEEVKNATLFVSALGVFKVFLNSKSVADDFLSPGWVDYSKKLPFVKYDITDALCKNNALGIVLGDGWAIGHIGSNYTFKRNTYNDRIEFTALLRIEYKNGEIEEISTDSTWKATSGAIRRSDIYMGEVVDARLDVGDFSAFNYDDSAWDSAEETVFKFSRNLYLEQVTIPPVVVKHTFVPMLIREKDGKYLYDITQNIAGVLNCTFKGDAGATIIIRHGEILSNGNLYTENLRKAEATDTFILSGKGEEKFRPLFTYHGFRFAELEIIGKAQILSVTAEAMYTDLRSTGDFACSDILVTRVYQNALWGQRDNFMSVPTDCPQRDERLGWTGDAQIFCQSAMYNMDCRKYYEKYLADIRDAQLGNGVIPAAAPLPHVNFYDYTGREAAAGWCEAICEIPMCHYRVYGDKKVIRDNLYAAKRLIDYYQTESPDYIRSGKGAYGDWLSLKTPTDLSVVSTLYYARAALLVSRMCAIVGDFEEEYYASLYEKIKSAFICKFIDNDGKILSDTQTSYVLAYSFGIIDKDLAHKNLERKFMEDDFKLTTGFLGIKFLLPTLCDVGLCDIAYTLIKNKEYPGWIYSVLNGATTIWEHWDSFTEEKGILDGMNSFNHYSLGSCTEWMYEYCLGIRPDREKVGFQKVKFAPCFDFSGEITWAKGHYDTDFGRISVFWKKVDNAFEYRVIVPNQIECEFDFGDMLIQEKTENQCEYVFVLKKKL